LLTRVLRKKHASRQFSCLIKNCLFCDSQMCHRSHTSFVAECRNGHNSSDFFFDARKSWWPFFSFDWIISFFKSHFFFPNWHHIFVWLFRWKEQKKSWNRLLIQAILVLLKASHIFHLFAIQNPLFYYFFLSKYFFLYFFCYSSFSWLKFLFGRRIIFRTIWMLKKLFLKRRLEFWPVWPERFWKNTIKLLFV
jgi:hypothetical protein